MKIAHLINPVTPPPGSDLGIAQPVTFESMRLAARFAPDEVIIELIGSSFPEDTEFPVGFKRTKDLERSVLDFGQFAVPRRLPLLADLLDRAYHESDADFVIYSNVDIALMPYFYQTVSRWLESGHDALIINRRTISDRYTEPTELPLMYAQLGNAHVGYDCFVFPRTRIPDLDVGHVCVGANRIGLVFALALHTTSDSLRLVVDSRITFHIGNDRRWKSAALQDYTEYNRQEAIGVIKRLELQYGPFDESLPSWAFKAVIDLEPGFLRRSWRHLRRLVLTS